LGHSREHGHLTVNMYIEAARVPTSCAEVARLAPPWHVEFCDPATGAAPMAYGLSYQGNSLVGAIYADGHAVVIEAIGDGEQANPITGSQLRAAVTAAAVHDVIPDAAAPGQ
ncbi:MAG: hypothetical protein HOV83_33825, partial [Catenulispora sp.]|nr:hypothetical protein [Catenulispora sp.]